MTQPALYVSHGSPMIVLDQSPARSFLEAYGRDWAEKPKAIIIASAHYEAHGPSLTVGAAPPMIYDFGGFPPALYQMQYPAPGAPALAEQAAALLAQAGFSPRLDPEWGFDHGTWTLLKLMRPEADVPVIAMSVDLRQSPEWHFNAGRALAPLREQGVAIIGSGSMTHNLRAFFTGQRPPGINGNEWVEQFRDWINEKIEAGAVEDLLNYRRLAPFARENHPTEDHFLPLFVALGAGGAGRRIHASGDHDLLAMDAFAFS